MGCDGLRGDAMRCRGDLDGGMDRGWKGSFTFLDCLRVCLAANFIRLDSMTETIVVRSDDPAHGGRSHP